MSSGRRTSSIRVYTVMLLVVALSVSAMLPAAAESTERPSTRPLAGSSPAMSDVGTFMPGSPTSSTLIPKAFGPLVVPMTQPAATTQPAVAVSALDAVGINRGGRAEVPSTQSKGAATSTSATTFDTGRVMLSLALVVGLILFLKWGGKKIFGMPSVGHSGVMQVVSRTMLAPKQQLLLVRVGRRILIVGDSGGRLSGIGQIEDPDEVAGLLSQSKSAVDNTPKSVNFAGMFRRLGQSRTKRVEDADWSELEDAAMAPASERSGLLGGIRHDSRSDLAGVESPSGIADESGEIAEVRDSVEVSRNEGEDEARAAVEAARYDIQALRAKLREVTGRLAGSDEANPPASRQGDARAPDAA